MAARAEAEREETQPTASSTPTRTSSTPAPSGADVKEVSLTAFRMQFPGLVSMTQGG
jgi:hypothetical protein